MPIFFFILTLISSYILIIVHLFHLNSMILFVKSITSLLFLATAFTSYKKNPKEPKLFRLIFLGLAFCFLGDFSFAVAQDEASIFFLFGIIGPALGHIMYIIAYSTLSKLDFKDLLIFPCIFIPTLATLLLIDFDFKGMFPFVIIYAILISFMLTKSFRLLKYTKYNTFKVTCLTGGSVLFFVSDFILLFYLFYPNASYILQSYDWFLYYLGQALIGINFSRGSLKSALDDDGRSL